MEFGPHIFNHIEWSLKLWTSEAKGWKPDNFAIDNIGVMIMGMGGMLSQVFTDSDGTKYAWNYKANSSSPTLPTRTLIRTIYLCPCPTNTSLLFFIEVRVDAQVNLAHPAQYICSPF